MSDRRTIAEITKRDRQDPCHTQTWEDRHALLEIVARDTRAMRVALELLPENGPASTMRAITLLVRRLEG